MLNDPHRGLRDESFSWLAEPPLTLWRPIGRLFFGAACLAGLFAGLLLMVVHDPTGTGPLSTVSRWSLVACHAVFALVSAWLHQRSADVRFSVPKGLFICAMLAVALISLSSFLLGIGLSNPANGFFGIAVCMLCAATGLRLGLWLAVSSVVSLCGVAWAQWHGLLVPADARSVLYQLSYQVLVVAFGASVGLLISRVLAHYLRSSLEREDRFRTLLGIAVDWYWEQDDEFRYTHITESRGNAEAPLPFQARGQAPWEVGGLALDHDDMDAHRADLEAHRSYNNLNLVQPDGRGRTRHFSLSGAPRFSTKGVFLGYWGVGRDITAQVRAQQAVVASESRYRALFERSPSPLVLHRRGTVLDANQSAAQLFGYHDASAMRGAHLFEHFHEETGDQRITFRDRLARAERLGLGEALPMEEYEIVRVDGRIATVEGTAVCVDTPGGAALLSIYVDVTARKQAETAVRRSEAMLSHLIATSPDVMTLSEVETGRLMLVNDRFVTLFGHRREDAVGRTSMELGIWVDEEGRQHFFDTVQREGRAEGVPLTVRRLDGSRVPMLMSGALLEFEGRQLLVMAARDLSESERTRLEVEAILNTVSLAIAFVRDQSIMRVNARHVEMFGWSEDELHGTALSTLWPEPMQFLGVRRQAMLQLRRREGYECETQLRRRDGSLFWCRVQAQSVDPSNPVGGGTIWSLEDITERRQFQQALAAARDAAEAASRAKTAFLANTSHEIRTPLNGLIGLAGLAMQPTLDEKRRQQYLGQIVEIAQSLSGIISDILDLSKVEAGRITLESLDFDLHDKLGKLHQGYEGLAEDKGLQLTLDVAPDVPRYVRGDPLRVRQILSNYLSNALTATEQGTIGIVVSMAPGGSIRLAVRDSGMGIDAATQQRLFTPFSQADVSTTRRYGGTGLGLSICRELAQLMGGMVGVDSVPGKGSEFWAELPLQAAEVPQDADESQVDGDTILRNARVLVAEDNPVNMLIVVAMLEQWGMHVTQAGDGAEAVAAVKAAADSDEPFDLVLMDVHMPVLSGHAAVRQLREQFDASTLPVVALTAAALTSEREEALAAGMNDFLTKPIDIERLRETMIRYLRKTASV